MIFTEKVVDCGEPRYIAECLYSPHQKNHFYLCDKDTLILALYNVLLAHFRTMHPTHNALRMTYMNAEDRKCKAIQ